MKTIATIFALLSGIFNLNAQVVLTRNNVPATGTMYVKYEGIVPSGFTFAQNGIGNTWDFSAVPASSGGEDTIYYDSPSSVPGGADFPGADLVSYQNGDKVYSFIKLENNGAYLTGLYGDLAKTGTDVSLPLITPVLVKPFPFSSLTQYQGSATLNAKKTGLELGTLVDSAWLQITNYTKVTVVASGNLVLPSGSYPAILEKSENISVDTVRIKFQPGTPWVIARTSLETDTTYKWYTQQTIEPYASVTYKKGQLNAVSLYKSAMALALEKEQRPSLTIKCYPNPGSDMIYLDIEKERLEQMAVYSSNGTLVSFVKSANVLNISDLQKGIYLAKIILNNGQVVLSNFVKN